MNKLQLIIGGVIMVLLPSLGFIAGWNAHKTFRPCPVITTDTIKVADPYWHHIADSLAGLPPVERIKWLPRDTLYVPADTIILSQPVNPVDMIRDYFSVYVYEWEKKTDTLDIELRTTVTENKPIEYDLKYNINKPFTTVINNIDNSVTYNRYITFGFDIPIYHSPGYEIPIDVMNVQLEANYIWDKGYFGVGYIPERKEFSVKLGTTLLKLKK